MHPRRPRKQNRKQPKFTPERLEKVFKTVPETGQNGAKSCPSRPKIDQKRSKNEAKRGKTSNQRLQDDPGAPRERISRLSTRSIGSNLEPKIDPKLKKNIMKNRLMFGRPFDREDVRKCT